MRKFLCSLFGHRIISYVEAPYDDCTRCGMQIPIPQSEATSRRAAARARVTTAR